MHLSAVSPVEPDAVPNGIDLLIYPSPVVFTWFGLGVSLPSARFRPIATIPAHT
jgi:hypothetical protein